MTDTIGYHPDHTLKPGGGDTQHAPYRRLLNPARGPTTLGVMDALSPRAASRGAITIGVVGTHELVERIMGVAHRMDSDWRLVGAAYGEEHESRARLRTMESRIDVCLFAGPLAYDLARAEADLSVPATYVPVSGAALYSALLRGVLDGACDPNRISVDSVSAEELAEAYAEIGLGTDHVHVHAYDRPESAAEFFSFHEALYRQGESTMALTTVPAVEQQLIEADIPVRRMIPTVATLRIALNTAALLGTGNRLEEAQIAIAIVQPTSAARPVNAGPSNYWQQELKLALHRELLRDARRMGATVLPRDEHGHMVITTLGALDRITEGFRVAPFLEHIQTELGLPVEVGIGLGMTARDAEAKAQAAVDKSTADGSAAAYVMGPGDTILALPARLHQPSEAAATAPADSSKGSEILERLLDGLSAQPGGPVPETAIVDADKVAALLDVTARTARRLLHTLVDEGLAWPLPPIRSARAGRPRQPYQLITRRSTSRSLDGPGVIDTVTERQ